MGIKLSELVTSSSELVTMSTKLVKRNRGLY